MSLLPRKGLLAIAAVVDVALHSRERPLSAKALAERHDLPPRHLVEHILRAAGRGEEDESAAMPAAAVLNAVVLPAVAEAERGFSAALARINVEDLARRADGAGLIDQLMR